jgi:hypothetical protein
MRGRNFQVARVMRILAWLSHSQNGLTVSDIHFRLSDCGFGVSLRTIYRDLDAIQASGVPLIREVSTPDSLSQRWTIFGRSTNVRTVNNQPPEPSSFNNLLPEPIKKIAA